MTIDLSRSSAADERYIIDEVVDPQLSGSAADGARDLPETSAGGSSNEEGHGGQPAGFAMHSPSQ